MSIGLDLSTPSDANTHFSVRCVFDNFLVTAGKYIKRISDPQKMGEAFDPQKRAEAPAKAFDPPALAIIRNLQSNLDLPPLFREMDLGLEMKKRGIYQSTGFPVD